MWATTRSRYARRRPTSTGRSARAAARAWRNAPARTPTTVSTYGVAPTKAINIPFPQAIPKKAKIDPQFCRQFIERQVRRLRQGLPYGGDQLRDGG